MNDKTNPVVGLDLDSLDTIAACDKGAEIELLHPVTQEKTGIFITILGKDSQAFRDFMKDHVDARLRREAVAERTGKMLPPPTTAQFEEHATRSLVVCTVSWRQEVQDAEGKKISKDTFTYKGQELPCNPANASMIYTNLLWIRSQVDKAIGEMENFMGSLQTA